MPKRPSNGRTKRSLSKPKTARERAKPSARKLPVLANGRTQVPCLQCALCCSYVAVEIDPPSTLRGANEILWYLYHQGVSVYADGESWMVQMDTRCRHLQADNRCGIYEHRPLICREFDETGCEVNAEEVGTTFYDVDAFMTYLQRHHKRIFGLVRKRYLPPPTVAAAAKTPSRRSAFRPRLEALRLQAAGARPADWV